MRASKMKLNERITQLAELGINVNTHKVEGQPKGNIVARFENGEGIEVISEARKRVDFRKKCNDPIYKTLVSEFGQKRANELSDECKLPGGYSSLEAEEHIIFDHQSGLQYQFLLPSRVYL